MNSDVIHKYNSAKYLDEYICKPPAMSQSH